MSIGENFIQPTEPIEYSDAKCFDSGASMHSDRPPFSSENFKTESLGRGGQVQIFCLYHQKFYIDKVKPMHRDEFITVIYDDRERERLNFDNEIWRNESTTDSLCVNNAQSHSADEPIRTVKDIKLMELRKMAYYFVNKTSLKLQAQEFEQFLCLKEYSAEDAAFLETRKIVPRVDASNEVNVIISHTLDNMKTNDGAFFTLKTSIVSHCNENTLRRLLSSGCATCPPIELLLTESIASLKG